MQKSFRAATEIGERANCELIAGLRQEPRATPLVVVRAFATPEFALCAGGEGRARFVPRR